MGRRKCHLTETFQEECLGQGSRPDVRMQGEGSGDDLEYEKVMVSLILVGNPEEEGLEEKNKFYFEQRMFVESVWTSHKGSTAI